MNIMGTIAFQQKVLLSNQVMW